MSIRNFLILLVFSAFSSCAIRHPGDETVSRRFSPGSDDLSCAIINYAVELKHDKHLRFEDSRICYHDDGGYTIFIKFTSQDILELCEARMLLVDVVEGLLGRLRSDESIPADLEIGSLSPDNLDITIIFESFFGYYVDPYYIGWMALRNGISHFYAFDTRDTSRDRWSAREELYSKSVLFVQCERGGEMAYKANHPEKKKDALKNDWLHVDDGEIEKHHLYDKFSRFDKDDDFDQNFKLLTEDKFGEDRGFDQNDMYLEEDWHGVPQSTSW